jgi:hypothetical protein
MRIWLGGLLLAILALTGMAVAQTTAPNAAQTAAQAAARAVACSATLGDYVLQAERLFQATVDPDMKTSVEREAAERARPGAPAAQREPRTPQGIQVSARLVQRAGTGTATGFSVDVTLRRPESGRAGTVPPDGQSAADTAKVWESLRFVGAARTVNVLPMDWVASPGVAIPEGHRYAALFVELLTRKPEEVTLRISTPESTAANMLIGEDWNLLLIGCEGDAVRLFGVVRVTLHSKSTAVALTAAFGIGFWLFVTFWAWHRNAARLQLAWQEAHPGGRPPLTPTPWHKAFSNENDFNRIGWKFLRATDPVFISQDGLGEGSLGRVQLLLFSTVVACLVLYVYLRTGVMVGFSNDVLMLLGITGGSTALSRLPIAKRAVSEQTEALLLRLGVVNVNRNMPSWGDTISSRGEVDVTRVQALLFTVIVLVALVVNGWADLANFSLPPQVNWLLGISQGVYIAGKLVPSEACERLDTAVKAWIAAAQGHVQAPGDAGAAARFAETREAVEQTVLEVYGERADLRRIKGATAQQAAPA